MTLYPAKANGLSYTDVDRCVSVTVTSTALAVATTANWLNVQTWNIAAGIRPIRDATDPARYTAVPEFDFELKCAATETITSPAIYGIRLAPFTYADQNFTTTHATETFDLNSHNLLTGDGPMYLSSSTTLPAGTSATQAYYVVKTGTNSFKLATSRDNAIAGTTISITSDGTGTHTIADAQSQTNPDNNTQRYHFYLYGSLNAGTTITLGAQTAYMERIAHSPLTHYYSVLGTSGTGAQTVVIRLCPVQPVEY